MIWKNLGLRPLHYRVLWWMIDMGAMGGALVRGWMNYCAEDLDIHRITLNRAMHFLKGKGFVEEIRRGTFGLVREAFESDADPDRVKVLQEKGAKRGTKERNT